MTTLNLSGSGAAYIRVSTDQQDTQRQTAAIAKWLVDNSATVAEKFRFEDFGYARDEAEKRPAFQRLLKTVEAGLIQWIIVDSQDRFGTKDAYEFGYYCHLLRRNHCRLYTVENVCLTESDLLSYIQGGLGAETSAKEVREKSLRVIEGMVAKAKRGEWTGGHIAYGIDIACIDIDGNELWRVLPDGRNLRIKSLPNGERKRYDGLRNFPPTSALEYLVQRPSVDASRLDAVREVFRRYAAESVSYNVLAKHLNSLGVKHHYAADGRFKANHIREMLANPIYVGCQTWNKSNQAKYYEIVGGKRQAVDKSKKRPRQKAAEDWVRAEGIFPPIVPLDTFAAVQDKLEKQPKQTRAPRSATLWLAGLVYCGDCGGRMRGYTRQAPYTPEYFCGTYNDGKGCKRNSVKHHLLEGIVRQYLADCGQQLAVFESVQQTGNLELLKPFKEKHVAAIRTAVDRYFTMIDRVGVENLTVTASPINGDTSRLKVKKVVDAYTLEEMYRDLFSREEAPLKKRAAELDKQVEKLTEQWLDLPTPRAKEIAKGKLQNLEAELASLQARLENVADAYDAAVSETQQLAAAYEAAAEALDNPEAEQRQIADAVRKVISRIVVKHSENGQITVEVVPVGSEEVAKYPNGGKVTPCTSPPASSSTTTNPASTTTTSSGWNNSPPSTPPPPATTTTAPAKTTPTPT